MSQEFSVSADVIQLVSEIVAKNDFDPDTNMVEYKPGSEEGDGYTSETIAADIKDKDKSLHLFIKCSNNMENGESEENVLKFLYTVETFFYDTIHPAYENFQKKRGVQVFENVPKLHGVARGSRDIIAMENLTARGYELYDRFEFYNEDHLTLILRTLARFHAVSFAFKDQERRTYQNWRGSLFDYEGLMKSGKFDQMAIMMIEDFFARLDPADDKDILTSFSDLIEVVDSSFRTLSMDYAIVTKGDSWNNNMLFQYEDENKEKPSDVMLIDWQMAKIASPIYDLYTIVYPMATQEILNNIEDHLKVYHEELSARIRELGSNPDKLYPYSAFVKEWDEIAPMALAEVIPVLKIMLSKKQETTSIQTMMDPAVQNMADIFPSYRNDDEYMNRVKMIARHLIKRKKMNFRKTWGLYEKNSLKLV